MTRKLLIAAAGLALTGVSAAAIAQADGFIRNPAQVQSGTYVLDASHGKITWSMDHMGFSTYVGQFTDVTATLNLDVRNPSASKLQAEVKTVTSKRRTSSIRRSSQPQTSKRTAFV